MSKTVHGRASKASPGSVRIIAGTWRRRRLPVAAIAGLRPTPDRVRETLFNWLTSDLPGARCLDLFAGTGALGLEAASRGAAHVTLVESDPRAAQQLKATCEMLGAQNVSVVNQDAMHWLVMSGEIFDVVFLDPPFGAFDLGQLCLTLEQHGRLANNARVYLESDAKVVQPVPSQWRTLRDGRAGRVRYYLASPP